MVKVNVSISVVSWGEFVKSVLNNLFQVYGCLIVISGTISEKQKWRSPQADEIHQFPIISFWEMRVQGGKPFSLIWSIFPFTGGQLLFIK